MTFAGDLPAARRDVEAAAVLSEAAQGVWIVRAALQQDAAKRMAVLETPLMASAGKPLLARASCVHSQMSGQLRAVSNCCEPGAPGRGGCDHSRWAMAT